MDRFIPTFILTWAEAISAIFSTFLVANLSLSPLVDYGGSNEVCSNHSKCSDTVSMGYVLFGGGAGMWYDMTKFTNGGVGLIFDLNVLGGVGAQSGGEYRFTARPRRSFL